MTEAGEIEPAISEWLRAGKTAEARYAFQEAQDGYQQALALLDLLPGSAERDDRELELRQLVILMLIVRSGHTAPETIDVIDRNTKLAEKSGKLGRLVDQVVRRGFVAYFSCDLLTASTLADQALDLALRDGNPAGLAYAHFLQITTRHSRGDHIGVEKHFTEGVKFFDNHQFRQNPAAAAVAVYAAASWNAWELGRADEARARMAQMIARADEKQPFQIATSRYYAAYLWVYTREYELAEALAMQGLELSENHRFTQFAEYSRAVLGYTLTQLDRMTEGIRLIRQGMATLLKAGTRSGFTRQANYLADAQARDGAMVDALETIEQALHFNPDELFCRAETLRIRGEVLLKQRNVNLAEADFRDAIALSQSMNAKAWQLRATTSLARLLASQGRRDEARSMLAAIYNWFTEGFDTADLKDAKALLEELTV